MTIAFVGMETSGTIRRLLQSYGLETYSCDNLPSQDGGEEPAHDERTNLTLGRHMVGDVFDTLENMWACDLWPEVGVFHPTCTYLTNSAAWAFKDPDFARYPGVGYHQRVKPGTLTGAARRKAREDAVSDVYRIRALKMRVKVIENPIGHLSSKIGPPTQIVQPYEFGDDASKATCLWVYVDNELVAPCEWLRINSAKRRKGRFVTYPAPKSDLPGGYVTVERWSNQTDSGQNRLSPSESRWADRSDTYPGIANALAAKLALYAYA
jgi:hypothetical protein